MPRLPTAMPIRWPAVTVRRGSSRRRAAAMSGDGVGANDWRTGIRRGKGALGMVAD